MKAISRLTQIMKYQTYIIIKIPREIVPTDIWRNVYTIDKNKTCKTDSIKTIFHSRVKLRLYNKRQIQNIVFSMKKTEIIDITLYVHSVE